MKPQKYTCFEIALQCMWMFELNVHEDFAEA